MKNLENPVNIEKSPQRKKKVNNFEQNLQIKKLIKKILKTKSNKIYRKSNKSVFKYIF